MTMGSLPLPYHCRYKVGGTWFDYYRRHGQRTRLPAQDSPEFYPAYKLAHDLAEARARQDKAAPIASATPGSMGALIAAYRTSLEWHGHAPATRLDYNKALNPLAERYGALPVSTMPRQFVKKLRNDYATMPAFTKTKPPQPILDAEGKQVILSTPRRANRMVNVLRLLISWAIDQGGWLKNDINPAARPGRLVTGSGYRMWSSQDVATFMSCEEIGEPLKRAAAVGLYTGQRKQDCLLMTKSARKGGAIEVVPEKTKRSTGKRLVIPEHPVLTAVLDAAPSGDAVMLLTREDGKPWGESDFNHKFADAVKAAGLKGLSFHGLRKAASSRLAEAGCTDSEIDAVLGHADPKMTRLYRQQADQVVQAKAAIEKLVRKDKK